MRKALRISILFAISSNVWADEGNPPEDASWEETVEWIDENKEDIDPSDAADWLTEHEDTINWEVFEDWMDSVEG